MWNINRHGRCHDVTFLLLLAAAAAVVVVVDVVDDDDDDDDVIAHVDRCRSTTAEHPAAMELIGENEMDLPSTIILNSPEEIMLWDFLLTGLHKD